MHAAAMCSLVSLYTRMRGCIGAWVHGRVHAWMRAGGPFAIAALADLPVFANLGP